MDVVVELVVEYISFEIGVRGMSPLSIKNTYLGAVNSFFGSQRVKNCFDQASKTFYVKYVLRGFLKIYSDLHPVGDAKKLAFTIELVQYTNAALIGSKSKRGEDPIFVEASK